MKHNVYDFDNTIYRGDSTADFYLFCLKKHPGILMELPILIGCFIILLMGQYSETAFKEKLYRFLRYVSNVDDLVNEFWRYHHTRVKDFYINGHNDNDIVISASPEFLLQPVCRSLNIHYLIASKVDKKTGLYSGENCWGKEKVRRFREEMADAEINEFYSDSLSDAPLAEIADAAFIVRGDRIIPWADYQSATKTY